MKQAVVLMNLGTPAEPTTRGVKDFLREFLSDPRVVEVPRPIWIAILHGAILPFRSPKVAEAYKTIWWPEGSPLRVISERQREKLDQSLQQRWAGKGEAPRVELAMTYSGPSMASVLDKLFAEGVERVLLLPLYPQYSATTTGSILDQMASYIKKRRDVPEILWQKHYCDHPLYIEALAQSVEAFWQQQGRNEKLLMSFHGIPKRNVDLGDPYYQQCSRTAKALAKRLELSDSEWLMCFQSRLGRAEWLKPYTADTLQQLPEKGCHSVDVICPAFAADCLETLEEMQVENREVFISAGGKAYGFIPCLNDNEAHIELLAELVSNYFPSA